ncbi:MAG: acyltransferase family protein [Candidatus Hodarchaeota archaeon]
MSGQEAEGLKTRFKIEKERINWIDQGRGLVMFLLILTAFLPDDWRRGNWFSDFFLEHPGKTDPWMNLYDVGVPAFFFIIGLLMAVSFKKRIEKKNIGNAILNSLLRWGLIFAVGLILFLAIDGDLGEMKNVTADFPTLSEVNMYVARWDVIYSIGFVGLLAIPFLFLPNKARLILSYIMMGFYQVMIFIPQTYWLEYAWASVHGGILGGIFILTPLVLIGSCIGEYYVLNEKTEKNIKNRNFLIFGAINLAIGLILWFFKRGFPNKRASTMGWAVISIAVIIGGLFAFIVTDYKEADYPNLHPLNKGRITLFKAYGMNPFLLYLLTEVVTVLLIEEILDIDLPLEMELVLLAVMLPALTLIAWLLYRKNKAISTTKIALLAIMILGALAVLILADVISL